MPAETDSSNPAPVQTPIFKPKLRMRFSMLVDLIRGTPNFMPHTPRHLERTASFFINQASDRNLNFLEFQEMRRTIAQVCRPEGRSVYTSYGHSQSAIF
jgi:hypothetical protein